MITGDDYETSRRKAFANSCESDGDFDIVATVHTHPDPSPDTSTIFNAIATWCPSIVNRFTATDFNQGIDRKKKYPDTFEKIVMISAKDHEVRSFEPSVDDEEFGAFSIWAIDIHSLSYGSYDWDTYSWRVKFITQY